MSRTLEETQQDVIRTRQNLKQIVEEYEASVRRGRILWGIVILLVASVIGLSWYGYPYIDESRVLLSQAPALQKLQNMTSGIGERVTSIEGKLSEWATDRTSLTGRMANLETKMGSSLATVRTQAQSFATQAGQRLRDEVNQGMLALQSRLGGVESAQRETQVNVSQLQTEISGLRQEMASMQQQNAQQLSDVQQAAKSDFNRLDNAMGVHTSRIDALNNQVDRQRVTFEISNNQTQQVTPEIYLTVKQTDVANQKVDGWMQLAGEGRIVWVRGLGAQESLTFSTRSDNRTHQLVFTAIGKNGATGYLLIPTQLAAR
jgi:outer membrane murein-binding lipoprotein Lpp